MPPERKAVLFAAVVIPLVRAGELEVVFVRRARNLRRNPGEIGFPGGLIDAGDADPRAAALREFEEELGVSRERVRIVAMLPDVVTLALSVTVTPFVGVVDEPVAFIPDPTETESVHRIPAKALYAVGAIHDGVERVMRNGTAFDVATLVFDYNGVHVWGATARILHGLIQRYTTLVELQDVTTIPSGLSGRALRYNDGG